MAGKNTVEQCSVGIHLNSPCFLSRYVKENFDVHPLDNLQEDIRQTIHFRSNMKEIPSICDHHKSTYTNRFTSFRHSKKCDNPFNNHLKSKRPLGSCTVTLASCLKVSSKTKFHLYPGQLLCVECNEQLHLLILHNTDKQEILNAEQTINNQNTSQVIFMFIAIKHCSTNIYFLLQFIDKQLPVNLSK
jgi:hypothetical protein